MLKGLVKSLLGPLGYQIRRIPSEDLARPVSSAILTLVRS
jgi:hypothetical protein